MYIVITDFDGYEQTRRCLKALEKSTYSEFSVVLVDHGTTKETSCLVNVEFPYVECISASSDLWWAGATNVGVSRALQRGAKRVVLLNNDCYVEKDTLSILVNQADLYPEAIIAPLQKSFQTGLITTSVIRTFFLLGFPTVVLHRNVPKDRDRKGLVQVPLIKGGRGVVIPASVFNTIGFFDEQELPHYYADHDFYLRARDGGVPLYLAINTGVAIDDTRTTLAVDTAAMPLKSFLASLKVRRSHRNVEAISAIFKRHYPLPHLYMIGISLYYVRYVFVYFLARSTRLFGPRKAVQATSDYR